MRTCKMGHRAPAKFDPGWQCRRCKVIRAQNGVYERRERERARRRLQAAHDAKKRPIEQDLTRRRRPRAEVAVGSIEGGIAGLGLGPGERYRIEPSDLDSQSFLD